MTDKASINQYQTKALIITAAGSSTRMGSGIKKEFISLGGFESVLSKATKAFLLSEKFDYLVITCSKGLCKKTSQVLLADPQVLSLIQAQGPDFHIDFIEGAESRQKSIYNALLFLNKEFQLNHIDNTKAMVLIHDGARPFVTTDIITQVVFTVEEYGAACPGIKVTDTQKKISNDSTISEHLIRSQLCAVQTPQGFVFSEIFLCHQRADEIRQKENKEFTDDTEIYDSFPEFTGGKKVHITEGSISNKKITYPSDLDFLKQKENRVGLGKDTHKLVEGRKFLLGGVYIPYDKGEEAHSDGDVLLHAITDALLGAAGLGDIGSYFPPEDNKWKDASSISLLQKCWSDVKAAGWSLVNLDCVVECEKPKLLPYRQEIISSVASILEVKSDKIFVKGKTGEKLDAVGQGLAVKADVICMLER